MNGRENNQVERVLYQQPLEDILREIYRRGLSMKEISKKHARILAALFVNSSEEEPRVYLTLERLQGEVAFIFGKAYPFGDIRSLADELAEMKYVHKLTLDDHGAVYGLEESGKELLQEYAALTEGVLAESSSPNYIGDSAIH